MTKAQKQAVSAFLIAIFATAMAFGAVKYFAPLTNLENKVADIRVAAMQPPMPPSKDVVVVAINEDTLTAFPYRSPVDRGFLADVITQLSAKGAKVIGVDVIVDQPTEPEKDARLKSVIDTIQTPLFMSYTSAPNVVNQDQLAYLNALFRLKSGLRPTCCPIRSTAWSDASIRAGRFAAGSWSTRGRIPQASSARL